MIPMLVMAAMSEGAHITVTCDNCNVDNTRSAAVCLANFRIDSDGDIYLSDNTGTYGASSQTWLDMGLNTQVWVSRTITTGTLDTDDIGAGRVICSSDLEIGVTRPTSGIDTATGVLTFWDAATGGNVLDTANYSVQAERT